MSRFQIGDKVRWAWVPPSKQAAIPVYTIIGYLGRFDGDEMYAATDDIRSLDPSYDGVQGTSEIMGGDYRYVGPSGREDLDAILGYYAHLRDTAQRSYEKAVALIGEAATLLIDDPI